MRNKPLKSFATPLKQKKKDNKSFSEKVEAGDITVDGKTIHQIRKENLDKERDKWQSKSRFKWRS